MIRNNNGLTMSKKSIDLIEHTGRTPIQTQLEIANKKLALAKIQYQKILSINSQLSAISSGDILFDKELNNVLARFVRMYNVQILECNNIVNACTNNIVRGPYLPKYIVEKNIGYQQVIYAYNRIAEVYESALFVVKHLKND